MHRPGAPFVLGNAWDVASALVLEDAGFEAVGTSSAGLAASLGRVDAEAVALDELVQVVARISAALDVPLSVDVESGFGPGLEDVATCVRKVLGAGAVGLNIEDIRPGSQELLPLAAAAERIAAARSAADAYGIPAVINARTDVFWRKVGPEEQRLEEALERLQAYVHAGADADRLLGVTRYGEALGLLFQIADDLLDVTQTSETLGKTAGKDSAQDKLTYPAVFGLAGALCERDRALAAAREAARDLEGDAGLLADLAVFASGRDR